MEGRAGGETRVKGREPALKGLSPPWQEIKGKQPQGGFQELGPLPGDSFQRHPWVSLTPRSRRRRRGICKVPPCSISGNTSWPHWALEHRAPLCLSLLVHPLPSRLLTTSPTLSRPGRGPGEAEGWAGPWDILFFFTPLAARPGMCNVPCVVTGLQECSHPESTQEPGRALGHRPGAQGALEMQALRGQGEMWAAVGVREEAGGHDPRLHQPWKEGKAHWSGLCFSSKISAPDLIQQEDKE